MKTKSNAIHIVPRENAWAVQKEGTLKASRLAPTKTLATQHAKKLSAKKLTVYVHNLDGTIKEVFTPQKQAKTPVSAIQKATKQRVHVLARKSDWAIKKENTKTPSKTFKNKFAAIRYAHRLADKSHAAMVVHTANGKINHIDIPPHFNSLVADTIHLR